jgi:hypothetical protein
MPQAQGEAMTQDDLTPIPMTPISVRSYGPGMFTHNLACFVCAENKAVFCAGKGRHVFQPCWQCQERGHGVIRLPRWLWWLLEGRR